MKKLVEYKCEYCGVLFHRYKSREKYLNSTNKHKTRFCSHKCQGHFLHGENPQVEVTCKHCNSLFFKSPSQIKKHPNNFCSQSCAASYNNTHKTKRTRRSKLEKWIESQLIHLYPTLDIYFNYKKVLKSELDIYIPSLKLAFELNGIFHYEPVFGKTKLDNIQKNDINKSHMCYKAKIDLCIIDVSGQLYFKPDTSKKYLDIITEIINNRLII